MIEKVKTMRHKQLDSKFSKDFRDLYDICMNKNHLTRPSATDLLGLDIVQKWAQELGLMNQQLLSAAKIKK
jgi:hypothetical protein